MPVQLREQAMQVSHHLATAMPEVDGVCLYGSVARGDERATSDIDLLVVGRNPSLSASKLRQRLPEDLRDARVTFAYHTPDTLAAYLRRWSRFGAHVRQEGEILFDRDGQLHAALEQAIPVSTREELEAQARHLENYDELGRFGGHFLFPLAHLYSIGRSVIFALLAEREILEFDSARAMQRLAQELPAAADEIHAVARLRPFHERATGRGRLPLPFAPRDCEVEVADARSAIRALIGRSRLADAISD
jgi:predicted nucleotidyltransferase